MSTVDVQQFGQKQFGSVDICERGSLAPKAGKEMRQREDALWHPRGTEPGADPLAADQRLTEFKG